MYNNLFELFIGFNLTIAGIFDGFKYSIQATKIMKMQSARVISRKSNNISIWFKVSCLIYGIYHADYFLISATILGLICSAHLFYITYLYYPYRRRGLWNFKRPSLIKYTWNSLLPNHLRKRL